LDEVAKRLEIAFGAGIQDQKLQAERARCRLRFCVCGLGDRIGGILEHGKARGARYQLMQQLHEFPVSSIFI
jgi:hypothetical protein